VLDFEDKTLNVLTVRMKQVTIPNCSKTNLLLFENYGLLIPTYATVDEVSEGLLTLMNCLAW